MTPLQIEFGKRFGEHRVIECPTTEGEMPLLLLDLELKSPVTVLITNGLSKYRMNIPEGTSENEFNELYFCLPSYWQWDELDNPRMNWIFSWIQRLSKYVQEKNSWFGHGHTMPCGKDMVSLSETMLQNHFFLSNPILLHEELTPFQEDEKIINFLAIIPIFGDEMDYKQGKGTFKFAQKLNSHGITEKLDDYRGNFLKSKWRMLKK